MIGMTNMVSKNSVSGGGAFRVNNCSYYADENMTWENWINSKYNIGVADGNRQLATNIIVVGSNYEATSVAPWT